MGPGPVEGQDVKLACGHPGKPENLIKGKCGTCAMIKDWQKVLKDTGEHPAMKKAVRSLIASFRSGDMVYDRNGKTILEWEKELQR